MDSMGDPHRRLYAIKLEEPKPIGQRTTEAQYYSEGNRQERFKARVHVGLTDILKSSGAGIIDRQDKKLDATRNEGEGRHTSLVLKSHEIKVPPKFQGHKTRLSLDAVLFQDASET